MTEEEIKFKYGNALTKFIIDEMEIDKAKPAVNLLKDALEAARSCNELDSHRYEISKEFDEKLDEIGKGKKSSNLPKEIVDAFKEPVKKEYVTPKCEVADDVIKFNGNERPGEEVPVCFDGIVDELKYLHAKKNHDYGNAAHESYKEFGLVSYVIRLNDKMKRLKSLTKPGAEQMVADEKIEDTLMDLAAYAIMAIESLRS